MNGFQTYDQWKTAHPPEYDEDIMDNEDFKEQFSDYDSLAALYHAVYKYTDCGPSLGVTIYSELPDNGEWGPESGGGPLSDFKTFYCDDLRKLGTFKDMDDQGILITELLVSSIVEGVDQCTDTYAIEWSPLHTEPKKLYEQFWQAVEDCNKEANEIWMETHGCPDCFNYPADDEHPVDPECKSCGGQGAFL